MRILGQSVSIRSMSSIWMRSGSSTLYGLAETTADQDTGMNEVMRLHLAAGLILETIGRQQHGVWQ